MGAPQCTGRHTHSPPLRAHTQVAPVRERSTCACPPLSPYVVRRPYRVFPFAVPNTTHERSWPTCGRARCRTPCVWAEVYLTLPYLRVHTKRRSSKTHCHVKVLDTRTRPLHEPLTRAMTRAHSTDVYSLSETRRGFVSCRPCAAWLGNRPPHARLG